MHPYRPQWQYGYAFAPGSAEANAYASYYQMYAGVPAQAVAPAPPQMPEPVSASTGPTYSSDFSSGASGFSLPPAAAPQQPYQKRPRFSAPTGQSYQPPTSYVKQPPPPPPQAGTVPKSESWQQFKQNAYAAPVPCVAAPAPAAATTAAVPIPIASRPKPIYPVKRFVRSQDQGRGGVEDDLDESPICQRVYDVAVFNKVKVEYEKIENEVAPGVFAVRLKMGTEVFTGTGSSHKHAKQAAAAKCLDSTTYNKPVYKPTMKARPPGATATQELFEISQRKGIAPKFVFIEPPNFEFKPAMRVWTRDEMRGRYVVELDLAGQKFRGESDLPQTAKHSAAIQALPVLHAMADVKPVPAALASSSNAKSVDSATLGLLPNGKNVIMALNEIAMIRGACIEWSLLGENGPPHMKTYVWMMKMGDYEANGEGLSKKIAKTSAALNMFNSTIPEDWRTAADNAKRKKKRKATTSTSTSSSAPTPSKQPNLAPQKPPETKPVDPKLICNVIQTAHPISALFEYCKKAKLSDPEFETVSETIVNRQSPFRKVEYTIKLEVDGKTFYGSAHTKKNAKAAVATEAWNIIRTGTM